MVRVIGVQKVELGIVDLVLSDPSFKFRSISRRRKKELIPQPLQLPRPRTRPIQATFLPHPSLQLVRLSAPQRSSSRPLPSAPGPSASLGLTQASSTTGPPSSSLLQLLCQSRHFQNPSGLLPFFFVRLIYLKKKKCTYKGRHILPLHTKISMTSLIKGRLKIKHEENKVLAC